MKQVRAKVKRLQRVVQGVVVARSGAVPVRAPAAARSGRCPLCRKGAATTDVTIAGVTWKVCEPCSNPVFKGLEFLRALSIFL